MKPTTMSNRWMAWAAAVALTLLDCSVFMGRSQEIIVPAGSEWRYWDLGSAPDADWVLNDYDDAGWAAGPAELGYGDSDEATVVSYGMDASAKFTTTYFRHSFSVADPDVFAELTLRILRDEVDKDKYYI